jgi:hypothetical protein
VGTARKCAVRGEDVEALVARIMGTPATLAERARDVLKPQ